MLRIDGRTIRNGSGTVLTSGLVPPDDAAFSGLDLNLSGPVEISGTLQATARETFVWRGEIAGAAVAPCRRCLAEVVTRFRTPAQAVFSADPDALEDPGVYRLPDPPAVIDLSDAVREEVALAVPAYPLCREECAGLCPRCGSDLNQGPCGCAGPPARE